MDCGIDCVGFEARGCGHHHHHHEQPAQVLNGACMQVYRMIGNELINNDMYSMTHVNGMMPLSARNDLHVMFRTIHTFYYRIYYKLPGLLSLALPLIMSML